MRRFRELPEIHRKAWIVGGIAGAIGGGLTASATRSYLFAILGALLFGVVGEIVGYCFLRAVPLRTVEGRIARPGNIVFAALSLVMAAASLFVLIAMREWIGLIGSIFFTLAALYFFRRLRAER